MSDAPKPTLQQIIKEEYKKCLVSPIYFMKKYCKIEHPIRGPINFELYPFQEKTLDQFKDNRFNIVLKSRQMGISTLVAGYSIWLMTFFESKNILVIATTQNTAKNLVTKVRFMQENLPNWLKVKSIEDNKLSLKLQNSSQIVAASSSSDSARSHACSLLVMDESAFISAAEEIWLSAQSTLSTGGNAILLSCVTKDTYVFDSNIGITKIETFINKQKTGPYEINEYSILGKDIFRKGILFHNNGLVKTKKIKTKFSNIECSFNHKLWAFKKEKNEFGWFKSEELTSGDFISIQYGINHWIGDDSIKGFNPTQSNKIRTPFNIEKLTPDLCYLFGLFISEGSGGFGFNSDGEKISGSITISCGDNISFIFDRLGLSYYTNDNLHYRISNKNLIELFEFVGFEFDRHAYRKKIPQKLMKISKENMVQLLRGIFDGDGWGTGGRVGLCSTSKELIEQVRMILNNFGILCSDYFYSKEQKNKYKGKIKHNHDTHSIEIYGKNALKFFNLIGFNVKRKSDGINDILKMNLNRSTSHNVIPNSLELVKKLYKLSNENARSIKEKHGLFINSMINKKTNYKTQNISSENVHIMYYNYKHLLKKDEIEYWDNIISDNIQWDCILDVSESEQETYDFSLPHNNDFWCHSVIYNGIIGHQTPNGVGNFFHKMWMEAEEGINDFNTIRLKWDLHPERDQLWRNEQDKILGEKGAAQECDCCFNSSGNTVIEMETLAFYKETFIKEPLEKRGFDHNYWIWVYPDYNRQYIISADVSRGDSSDYSTFHVIDVVNSEQVAEYKGKLSPKDFGNLLMAAASEYNNAIIVVENATIGYGTIQQIIDKAYPNLFYSSSDLQYVDLEHQMTNKINREEKKMVPGFTVTSRTRPLIISKLDMYFRERSINIKSIRTLEELYVFIWNNGKAEAMKTYNDDLVMALAIGLWVRDTAFRLKQEGVNLQKTILNSMTTKSPEPFYTNKEINHNPWKMNMPNGEGENLSWLL